MRLREFLHPGLVVLDLEATERDEVIRSLVGYLARQEVITEPDALVERLLERERSHTTALDCGVAVPHAMVPGLDRSLVLVGIAPEGTAFGPPELDAVRVFFLVLSPPSASGQHIKLLARIARLACHPSFLARLTRAGSPATVLQEVERIDSEHV